MYKIRVAGDLAGFFLNTINTEFFLSFLGTQMIDSTKNHTNESLQYFSLKKIAKLRTGFFFTSWNNSLNSMPISQKSSNDYRYSNFV